MPTPSGMLIADMFVHTTTPARAETRADIAAGHAAVSSRTPFATWRQLLPAHRLPVIAKTPFLVALGWHLAGGGSPSSAFLLTLALSSGLWATLYVLNEATDLSREQGLLVRKRFRFSLLAACVVLCAGACWLSPLLGALFVLMTLGQLAYCMPPLRWKRHWAANVILSGGANPVLRLHCGAIWGAHPLPLLIYAICIAAHLGACLRARALLRARDARLGYVPAPPGCEWAGLVCALFAIGGVVALCFLDWLPRYFLLFCFFAFAFTLYAWSGRATDMAHLRRGWIVFALIALVALVALLHR